MPSLNSNGWGIEKQLQQKWGDRPVFKAFNFCAPSCPEQVLAEIKAQGFDKLLIYPPPFWLSIPSLLVASLLSKSTSSPGGYSDTEHWVKRSTLHPLPFTTNPPTSI